MNQIVYSGHLTADIETRPVGEHQVHKFTVAVNEGKERVTFIPTEAWDMPHLEQYLGRGSKVLVRGNLRQFSWETDNGEKRSRMFVTARQVEFLDPRPENGENADKPETARRPPRGTAKSARSRKADDDALPPSKRRPDRFVREEAQPYHYV